MVDASLSHDGHLVWLRSRQRVEVVSPDGQRRDYDVEGWIHAAWIDESGTWLVAEALETPPADPSDPGQRGSFEILSPSTQRDDRHLKLPLYARAGITHVWLIDPAAQIIEVFETIAGRPTQGATVAGEEVARLAPFDDLPIALVPLWLPGGTDAA